MMRSFELLKYVETATAGSNGSSNGLGPRASPRSRLATQTSNRCFSSHHPAPGHRPCLSAPLSHSWSVRNYLVAV